MKRHMIRSIFALVTLCALLLTSLPALADGAVYMYVQTGNSGRLHLRAQPTTHSASLGLYPNGTPVAVESTQNGWAAVVAGGQRGFMSLRFLSSAAPINSPVSIAPPTPTENTPMVVRTGNSGRLHLRSYASQRAPSLGLYQNGTPVTVLHRDGDWAYVRVSNASGYMMLRFLSAAQTYTPSQPQLPTGSPVLKYVQTGNSGRLHLRLGPSTGSVSLGLFSNGTQVYAVDLGNGWSQVVADGMAGYMMTKFLSIYPPAAPIQPSPTQAPQTGGVVKYVSAYSLFLRENASEDAASLGEFRQGTAVEVLRDYGGWAYVKVHGALGYMQSAFLASSLPQQPAASPAPVYQPGQATVRHPNGSFVYMRSSTSSDNLSNVICQVPSGAVVEVLSWQTYWCRIRYNGTEGYMVTSYLK